MLNIFPCACWPSVYLLWNSVCPEISQVRILKWVAISWPRDWTHISCIGRWILCHWATREALLRPRALWNYLDSVFLGLLSRIFMNFWSLLFPLLFHFQLKWLHNDENLMTRPAELESQCGLTQEDVFLAQFPLLLMLSPPPDLRNGILENWVWPWTWSPIYLILALSWTQSAVGCVL